MTPNSRHEDGRRLHRAGQTAGAQLAARIISGLCVIIQTPLLLRHLGTDSFGWLMVVTAFVGVSQFADFGAAIALQQQLSVAWGKGEEERLAAVFAGGRLLLGRIAAITVLPGVVLAGLVGTRLLPAPNGTGQLVSWVVVVLSVALGLRLSAGPRLAAAVQAGWIAAVWAAVGNLAAVAAIVICIRAHAGLATFVAILAAAQALPGALTEVHILRRLRLRPPEADTEGRSQAAASIWNEGVHYALPNLAGATLQVATPLILSQSGGYAASAAFSVLQKLFGLVVQGHALTLAPLWPAYAEAEASGNRGWVNRAFGASLALTLACAGGILAVAFFLPWVTGFWLGAGAPAIGVPFAWLIALWSCSALVNQALSYFLLGIGALARIAFGIGCAHFGTLALMVLGGYFWQGLGVAAGLATGALVFATPQYVVCAVRLAGARKDSTRPKPPS